MAMKINGLYLQEREPDAVVGGCIAIYENVWPNPQETIDAIEQECSNLESGVSWQRAGTIGAGAYQNIRTNLLMDITYYSDITNNSKIQNVNNIFYTALLTLSNSYAKKFKINEPFFHENYQLLKYRGGEYYDEHYDGGTSIGRSVSALCYLNDDYEGGEIEFINFNVKVKPQAGMIILFPSNYAYRHVAHSVISGTKYALVTWIRDRQG
jgi:Rps23 Pro-64 3,4-dihydroxylase Tpa1-like proline 4-hydroxylase